ncbi:MAG: hypothetical protein U9N62_08675 [Thermotogota bacterium]|nr:hypothetical protein [Thermotogota bacterium]
MVTRKDYTAEAVKAAHSVLIELMHLLGEYRENIVLIGGWVPDILFGKKGEPHVGSIDVDLALDHKKLKDEGYRTIRELLLNRGYKEGDQPFVFERTVDVNGNEVIVEVDFLAGEYEGTGKRHRHQKIEEQGMRPRKARGCDIAFENPIEETIEGKLPGGGKDSVKVRVASIVPFFVMKGMAMEDRLKEKDPWDVYYCIKNYSGGVDALVEEFKPHVGHGLVKEGLEKIAKNFASEKHVGPKFVADFEELEDAEEREILERDAYERVNYLLKKLGIS